MCLLMMAAVQGRDRNHLPSVINSDLCTTRGIVRQRGDWRQVGRGTPIPDFGMLIASQKARSTMTGPDADRPAAAALRDEDRFDIDAVDTWLKARIDDSGGQARGRPVLQGSPPI